MNIPNTIHIQAEYKTKKSLLLVRNSCCVFFSTFARNIKFTFQIGENKSRKAKGFICTFNKVGTYNLPVQSDHSRETNVSITDTSSKLCIQRITFRKRLPNEPITNLSFLLTEISLGFWQITVDRYRCMENIPGAKNCTRRGFRLHFDLGFSLLS